MEAKLTSKELAMGRPSETLAATGIVVLVLLMLVVVMHHPVARHADATELVTDIARQAASDRWVHGILAGAMTMMTSLMLGFAARLGLGRPQVLLGAVSSALALVLNCQAVLLDGFIAPALTTPCAALGGRCAGEVQGLLRLGALQIEYLTRFGLILFASATALWAADLMFRKDRARFAGGVGLVSAGVQFGLLVAGRDRLNPHTLGLIVAAQAAWYLSVAWVIALRKGPFSLKQ
jgi:hypothetical protein